MVLSDHPRSNENETIRSGLLHIGACVTTEKQEANAAVGFGYREINQCPVVFRHRFHRDVEEVAGRLVTVIKAQCGANFGRTKFKS